MSSEGLPEATATVAATPKPKPAHDCLDASNKGNCEVDAAVIVVQEGNKVERRMIGSIEEMNAIRGYRKSLEDVDPTIDLGRMVGGMRGLLEGNEILFAALTATLAVAFLALLRMVRR